MLTEFVIEGGKHVGRSAWLSKLSELGISCEIDPTFDLHAHEGFVRIRWQRANERAIDVGFDLCIGMPAPDIDPETFAKVIGRYERMAANLRASKLPRSFAEAMQEKLVDLRAPKRTQRVRIRVDSKDSRPGDYAAAALFSAAYAAISGGTLNDRENGKQYTGNESLTAMAKSKYIAMPGKNVEFTTWESAEPDPATKKKLTTKPTVKKPTATKKLTAKPTVKKLTAKKAAAAKPAKKSSAKKRARAR